MKPFAKRIALVMGVVACALAASAVAEEYMAPPSGLSEEGRHAFREFLEARYHKAFAIGRHGAFGWRSGRSSAEEAIEEALATCRRYASDCELVMVDDERGGGRPPPQSYSPPPQYYSNPTPSPSYSGPSLSHLQQEALEDGCRLRYSGNPHKYRECLDLGANWRDALAQGCEKRYSGVPRKLRECMDY